MSNRVRLNRRLLLPLILASLLVALILWRGWSAWKRTSQLTAPSELQLNAFVVLQASDPETVASARDAITAQGGRVFNYFPPRVLLASIPATADAALTGQAGITAIHRHQLDVQALGELPETQVPVTVWSRMLQRGFRSDLGRSVAPQQVDQELALVPPEKLQEVQPATTSLSPGLDQTSEFMCGTVGLDIFFLESNGTLDVNSEDWTSAQRDKVAEEVVAGSNWWIQTATTGGQPSANLSFVYSFHDPWNTPQVSTRYEPITRSWQDVSLSIAEVMSKLGYKDSNWISAVRRYLNDQRKAETTDWRVAIFVVNSANDADGAFADHAFAFAYLNGPCLVLTYDGSVWGADSMEIVIAHELAHTFGALDEYLQSPFSPQDTAGYLDVVNSNSENGHATEESIMRNPLSLLRSYQAHLASTPARGMLGWSDSDGDGLYDVLGTTHNELVPTHLNPVRSSNVAYDNPTQHVWNESWRVRGLSRWYNSIGIVHAPVSINYVKSVLYRVDGGTWQAAIPRDGKFDAADEGYAFTVTGLGTGRHTVESLVVNPWLGDTALRQDTLDVDLAGVTPVPPPTATPPMPTPSATTIVPTKSPTAWPTPTLSMPTETPTIASEERITLTLQNGLWDYNGCQDTRISAEVPTSNLGTSDLKVGARQRLATLMVFNLSSIPHNAVIDSATLSLFANGREGTGSFDVEVYPVQRAWVEAEATWMKARSSQLWAQPGCNGTPEDRVDMPTSYVMVSTVGWYTWMVREDVQRMVSQSETNQGWLLRQSAALPGVLSMCSSEYTGVNYRPKLVITYRLQ